MSAWEKRCRGAVGSVPVAGADVDDFVLALAATGLEDPLDHSGDGGRADIYLVDHLYRAFSITANGNVIAPPVAIGCATLERPC